MATNDFLPFGTNGGAPVLSQAAYAAITPGNGFQAGLLTKEKLNKALRQANAIASMIGYFMGQHGQDALDDGDMNQLFLNYQAALENLIGTTASTSGRLLGQTQITSSGTWTVPAGVNLVNVRAIGGGGGGGGSNVNADGGGGGGGGGGFQYIGAVTPGSGIPLTIGAGGTAGHLGTGGTGGSTVWAGAVFAYGGVGGGTRNGGDGGYGGGPAVLFKGGAGGFGEVGSETGFGGSGGSSFLGGGSFGGAHQDPGNNASANTGGGGSGGTNNGGAGGSGLIVIEMYS